MVSMWYLSPIMSTDGVSHCVYHAVVRPLRLPYYMQNVGPTSLASCRSRLGIREAFFADSSIMVFVIVFLCCWLL